MAEDDAMPSVLAEHLQRVVTASNEATRLLEMHLDRRNLIAELLHRIRTISEAADSARRSLVLEALDAGMSVRDTARAAGLGPATIQRWKSER
ncbi:helix-turn-helix domain-containing protein [Mycobacterium avium]|uniref:helix-turn-helix domain-containing protein n=1 Tax=Mycobacterium avium TaxID=1764 RepID=UPI000A006DFB|nr:helix-turn-helix domain-containing protein [Mycobacterium avium]